MYTPMHEQVASEEKKKWKKWFFHCSATVTFLAVSFFLFLSRLFKNQKSSNFSLAPFVPVSWKWFAAKTRHPNVPHYLSVTPCLSHARFVFFSLAFVDVTVVIVYRWGVLKSYTQTQANVWLPAKWQIILIIKVSFFCRAKPQRTAEMMKTRAAFVSHI